METTGGCGQRCRTRRVQRISSETGWTKARLMSRCRPSGSGRALRSTRPFSANMALADPCLLETKAVFDSLDDMLKPLVANNLRGAVCTRLQCAKDYGGTPRCLHCNSGVAVTLEQRLRQCPAWAHIRATFPEALQALQDLSQAERAFAIVKEPSLRKVYHSLLAAGS